MQIGSTARAKCHGKEQHYKKPYQAHNLIHNLKFADSVPVVYASPCKQENTYGKHVKDTAP
jgi:predicted RNA-binding protein with PUA-like domain